MPLLEYLFSGRRLGQLAKLLAIIADGLLDGFLVDGRCVLDRLLVDGCYVLDRLLVDGRCVLDRLLVDGRCVPHTLHKPRMRRDTMAHSYPVLKMRGQGAEVLRVVIHDHRNGLHHRRYTRNQVRITCPIASGVDWCT